MLARCDAIALTAGVIPGAALASHTQATFFEAPRELFKVTPTARAQTVKGELKPLYSAFPVPLVVSKSGHRYSLWGLVRPASGVTVLQVLVLTRGAHRYRVLATVHTNSSGYWTLHTSTPGVKWRARWRSPSGNVDTGPGIA